jgi:hypothetical protein
MQFTVQILGVLFWEQDILQVTLKRKRIIEDKDTAPDLILGSDSYAEE